MNLPEEIINHIFSYMKGPTNDIIKQFFKDIKSFKATPCYLFRLNRQYNFILFDAKRFYNAYYYECDDCGIMLDVEEYKQLLSPYKLLNQNYHYCGRCFAKMILWQDKVTHNYYMY
jgi:hypothetical protein